MNDRRTHRKRAGRVERIIGRVHGIETGYINLMRIVLATAILVGVIALVVAIAWYSFTQLAGVGAGFSSPNVAAPGWESIRYRVLPRPREQPQQSGVAADKREMAGKRKQPVDERIGQIANNLNAQFQRNAGHENGFTERYPGRLLEAWVFGGSELPESYLPDYLDALIILSEAIGKDEQINRIGSIDSRAQVMMNALEAFRQEFLVQVEEAENRTAAAALKRSEAITGSIYLGLGGLGLLIALALIVVLIRIEVHLRNQSHWQALAHRQATQIRQEHDRFEE